MPRQLTASPTPLGTPSTLVHHWWYAFALGSSKFASRKQDRASTGSVNRQKGRKRNDIAKSNLGHSASDKTTSRYVISCLDFPTEPHLVSIAKTIRPLPSSASRSSIIRTRSRSPGPPSSAKVRTSYPQIEARTQDHKLQSRDARSPPWLLSAIHYQTC